MTEKITYLTWNTLVSSAQVSQMFKRATQMPPVGDRSQSSPATLCELKVELTQDFPLRPAPLITEPGPGQVHSSYLG